jgi:hypothetical protein
MTKRHIHAALALKPRYAKIQLLMHDKLDGHYDIPARIPNCNVGKNPY